jgi:molybdate transport system substrate-binding protein
MQPPRTRLTFVLIGFLFWPCSQALAIGSVTVMADNSMSLAIAEIARHYSARNHVVVNTSFASSKIQETQITEGSAADVLITPKQQWIDDLKTRGLIDVYSPTPVARNHLALVGPINSEIRVAPDAKALPTASIIVAIGGEPGFVVAHPETLMEGGYSKEALRNLAGDYLEPYTLYIKQLDQMFSMIDSYQAYGLFLYSSTINRSGIRVLGKLPENAYTPIQYFAVVIAGDNMDEARRFLEYLKSPEAKIILQDNGFTLN